MNTHMPLMRSFLHEVIEKQSPGCVCQAFFMMLELLEDYTDSFGTCDCDICVQFKRNI